MSIVLLVVFPNRADVLENLLNYTESRQWVDMLAFEILFKQMSNPTIIDEGTTAVIISGMNFGNFGCRPLDTIGNPKWWMIPKLYLHCEIANSVPIYWGHNSQINLFQFLCMASRTINYQWNIFPHLLWDPPRISCLDHTTVLGIGIWGTINSNLLV